MPEEVDNCEKDQIYQYHSKTNGVEVHNVLPCKIPAITNGYDVDDFTSIKKVLKLNEYTKLLLIGFNGVFYKNERLPTEKVISAICHANEKGHTFLSIYKGHNLKVAELIKKHNAQKDFMIHKKLEHKKNLIRIALNHALIVILEKIDFTDKTVSLKLYEYLNIPKPIVGNLPSNGYAAEIITKTDSGLIFDPDSNLGGKFYELYKKLQSDGLRRKVGGNTVHYSWDFLVEKWEHVIEYCFS